MRVDHRHCDDSFASNSRSSPPVARKRSDWRSHGLRRRQPRGEVCYDSVRIANAFDILSFVGSKIEATGFALSKTTDQPVAGLDELLRAPPQLGRFGDDLGFKRNTLLSDTDIKTFFLPQYRRVIGLIKTAGKPFLWHSCGCIFPVMDDVIALGIDAKHSNEDQIAPFSTWVDKYGDRIGNFGGRSATPRRGVLEWIKSYWGN